MFGTITNLVTSQRKMNDCYFSYAHCFFYIYQYVNVKRSKMYDKFCTEILCKFLNFKQSIRPTFYIRFIIRGIRKPLLKVNHFGRNQIIYFLFLRSRLKRINYTCVHFYFRERSTNKFPGLKTIKKK